MQGKVLALSVSTRKGVPKSNVPIATLVAEWGMEGDAHAGAWHRQVSLLAIESFAVMRREGVTIAPGQFAENITTEGLTLAELPIGTRLAIGDAVVEITQIGKECHQHCAIFHRLGDCVMPREGIFARVLTGGTIGVGERITVLGTIPEDERVCTDQS